jgi:hypothetical protein
LAAQVGDTTMVVDEDASPVVPALIESSTSMKAVAGGASTTVLACAGAAPTLMEATLIVSSRHEAAQEWP